MVELRKRKTPPPQPEKPAKKKPGPRSKAQKAKEAVTEADAAKAQDVLAETATDAKDAVQEAATQVQDAVASAVNGATTTTTTTTPAGKPEKGSKIELDGFGGEIETHDGKKVSLKQLVDESAAGVVLFTYPKASTQGCTKQACLFRDAHTPLTATGYSIYGLSADSPKANLSFKTKQNLPFTLLCDAQNTLLRAIGLAKTPKGAVRGVFVVDKSGTVRAAEAGGPDRTLAVARDVAGAAEGAAPAPAAGSEEDRKRADVAGEVADTAQRVDGGKAE
ncbi:uncharacterized protein K452DRAFT_226955 [Aplosporella prunicola CBS 121167]|uniref:thioredoxin-dependent peroxiredoxin n=1 Tax=Aplosporella prunicola CBS 121167 TaxID=1176127 RepID=A0A6A6BDZ5_9PEZI|nr:uncharacterized protein K452DRAFT_226955 [Aplosporella prunicola CBS 121167]KAF2142390.1 hypothetical protein K452DRAFT_226955 [Aplosporella prunicola CBS 121167]